MGMWGSSPEPDRASPPAWSRFQLFGKSRTWGSGADVGVCPTQLGWRRKGQLHGASPRGQLVEEPLDHHFGRDVDQTLADRRDGAADLHVAFIVDVRALAGGRELEQALAFHEADLPVPLYH